MSSIYMQLKCMGGNRATWEFVEFQTSRMGIHRRLTPRLRERSSGSISRAVTAGTSQRFIHQWRPVGPIRRAQMPGHMPQQRGFFFQSAGTDFRCHSLLFKAVVFQGQGRRSARIARSADCRLDQLSYMNQKGGWCAGCLCEMKGVEYCSIMPYTLVYGIFIYMCFYQAATAHYLIVMSKSRGNARGRWLRPALYEIPKRDSFG